MVEHPWLLIVAVIVCSPLIWVTFRQLFPNLPADLEEDGVPLAIGVVTDFWIATWSFFKLLVFVSVSAAFVTAAYKLAVWLFV